MRTYTLWGLAGTLAIGYALFQLSYLQKALFGWPATPALLVLLAAVFMLPYGKLWSIVKDQKRDLTPTARAYLAKQKSISFAGYGLIVLLAGLAINFALANKGALIETFFRLDLIAASAEDIFTAALVNLKIIVVSSIASMVWGLVVAIAKMAPGPSGKPFRLMAKAYTDTFLSLPAVIVIYLVGFGLPLTKASILENVPLEGLICLALTLTYGAYLAEAYRAGLESIHPSQWSAARSLGISYNQSLRHVIIPQALRKAVPPLLTNLVSLQKDSALVGFVGVVDMFNQSKIIASNDFNLSAMMLVAVIFLVITIPQTRLVDYLLAKEQQKRS